MSDSNVSRERSRERFLANKRAFDDVIGDPYAYPLPITGHYITLKSRSSIAAMNNNFDEGKATRNPATPNIIDFFCDVERILTLNLQTEVEVGKFTRTYITEDDLGEIFTAPERTKLEQEIGKAFRVYSIAPVSKYFTTIRQKTGDRKERK
jgi:hypothetical protein